jgi:hypothetical protein
LQEYKQVLQANEMFMRMQESETVPDGEAVHQLSIVVRQFVQVY